MCTRCSILEFSFSVRSTIQYIHESSIPVRGASRDVYYKLGSYDSIWEIVVRVIGSNSRCMKLKADIIPQHLPSADLGPYMRTHIETTAVGGPW